MIRVSLFVMGAAFVTAVSLAQANQRLGAALRPGMQLIYESSGVTTPWAIDSVSTAFAVGTRSDCSRIVLRIGTGQPQTRTHCAVADTMMNWDDRAGRLVPARRLSLGVLEIPTSTGGRVRFEVLEPQVAMIDTEGFAVLPTVVTTFDSTGKAIRRLTERFAPSLATATEGEFAVPDSVRPDQWRVTQRFRLTAIRR